MMLVLATLLLPAASPAIRPFTAVLDRPHSLTVAYGGAIADDRLWLSGPRVVRTTLDGKVDRDWDMPTSSVAPAGDDCWAAQRFGDGQIHFLSAKGRQRFPLGSDPVVCRCRASSDSIALAGRTLWLLKNGSARRLSSQRVPSGQVLLDAVTRDVLAIGGEDAQGKHANLYLRTGGRILNVRIPGSSPLAVLRATPKIAFALVQPTLGSKTAILYRVDLPSAHAQVIAKIQKDYRETLGWDNAAKSVYLNYSDGECSRVESLSTNGKVLWISKRFDEFVTGISVADNPRKIYCVTKAGPIYLLAR